MLRRILPLLIAVFAAGTAYAEEPIAAKPADAPVAAKPADTPVAKPERPRNTQVLEGSANGLLHLPLIQTNVANTTMMMAVRTSVAKSESTP